MFGSTYEEDRQRSKRKSKLETESYIYQEKLNSIELELNAAVASHMKIVKRAADAVKMLQDEMVEVKSSFKDIGEMCDQCRGGLSEYPQIRKVNVARTNIKSTLDQVACQVHVCIYFEVMLTSVHHVFCILSLPSTSKFLPVCKRLRPC